jgi:membrane-bound ClpP family serine protease
MATQSIVDYLRSKFTKFEVIVPTYAMSAGTMMALASDVIVLGNQSQLGPIDPQLNVNGQQHSARAIVEQFEQAQTEIMANPMAAHVWAPIIGSHGPALLQYAQDQLDFSKRMVANWITKYMMASSEDPAGNGERIADYFNNASIHKSHDKRIGIDEALEQGVVVEKLEDNQALQEAVLTLYHVFTIIVEQTSITKLLTSGPDRQWVKNWVGGTP